MQVQQFPKIATTPPVQVSGMGNKKLSNVEEAKVQQKSLIFQQQITCLLYTSDAADE